METEDIIKEYETKTVDFIREYKEMIRHVFNRLLTNKAMAGDEISSLFTEYEGKITK